MKLRVSILAAVAAGLALAAPAVAKGPSDATVTGPGLKGGGLHLTGGSGDPASGTPLGDLADAAGFFPAAYERSPNPMLARKPAGDLGPKYGITYRVPGPNGTAATLRQDLYPYASGGPVSYMRPGQPVFEGITTYGGWFLAPRDLKGRLIGLGLPAVAPSTGAGGGWAFPWGAVTIAGAAAVALLLAVTF